MQPMTAAGAVGGEHPHAMHLRILAMACYRAPPNLQSVTAPAAGASSSGHHITSLRCLAACLLAGVSSGPAGPHTMHGAELARGLHERNPEAWRQLGTTDAEREAQTVAALADGAVLLAVALGNGPALMLLPSSLENAAVAAVQAAMTCVTTATKAPRVSAGQLAVPVASTPYPSQPSTPSPSRCSPVPPPMPPAQPNSSKMAAQQPQPQPALSLSTGTTPLAVSATPQESTRLKAAAAAVYAQHRLRLVTAHAAAKSLRGPLGPFTIHCSELGLALSRYAREEWAAIAPVGGSKMRAIFVPPDGILSLQPCEGNMAVVLDAGALLQAAAQVRAQAQANRQTQQQQPSLAHSAMQTAHMRPVQSQVPETQQSNSISQQQSTDQSSTQQAPTSSDSTRQSGAMPLDVALTAACVSEFWPCSLPALAAAMAIITQPASRAALHGSNRMTLGYACEQIVAVCERAGRHVPGTSAAEKTAAVMGYLRGEQLLKVIKSAPGAPGQHLVWLKSAALCASVAQVAERKLHSVRQAASGAQPSSRGCEPASAGSAQVRWPPSFEGLPMAAFPLPAQALLKEVQRGCMQPAAGTTSWVANEFLLRVLVKLHSKAAGAKLLPPLRGHELPAAGMASSMGPGPASATAVTSSCTGSAVVVAAAAKAAATGPDMRALAAVAQRAMRGIVASASAAAPPPPPPPPPQQQQNMRQGSPLKQRPGSSIVPDSAAPPAPNGPQLTSDIVVTTACLAVWWPHEVPLLAAALTIATQPSTSAQYGRSKMSLSGALSAMVRASSRMPNGGQSLTLPQARALLETEPLLTIHADSGTVELQTSRLCALVWSAATQLPITAYDSRGRGVCWPPAVSRSALPMSAFNLNTQACLDVTCARLAGTSTRTPGSFRAACLDFIAARLSTRWIVPSGSSSSSGQLPPGASVVKCLEGSWRGGEEQGPQQSGAAAAQPASSQSTDAGAELEALAGHAPDAGAGAPAVPAAVLAAAAEDGAGAGDQAETSSVRLEGPLLCEGLDGSLEFEVEYGDGFLHADGQVDEAQGQEQESDAGVHNSLPDLESAAQQAVRDEVTHGAGGADGEEGSTGGLEEGDEEEEGSDDDEDDEDADLSADALMSLLIGS